MLDTGIFVQWLLGSVLLSNAGYLSSRSFFKLLYLFILCACVCVHVLTHTGHVLTLQVICSHIQVREQLLWESVLFLPCVPQGLTWVTGLTSAFAL